MREKKPTLHCLLESSNSVNMKLYHATTKEYWEEIQKEGVLWGRKNQYWQGNKMSRITWLALKKENTRYGKGDGSGEWAIPEVLLEVELPAGEYAGDTWQIRYYEPIPISQVKRV